LRIKTTPRDTSRRLFFFILPTFFCNPRPFFSPPLPRSSLHRVACVMRFQPLPAVPRLCTLSTSLSVPCHAFHFSKRFRLPAPPISISFHPHTSPTLPAFFGGRLASSFTKAHPVLVSITALAHAWLNGICCHVCITFHLLVFSQNPPCLQSLPHSGCPLPRYADECLCDFPRFLFTAFYSSVSGQRIPSTIFPGSDHDAGHPSSSFIFNPELLAFNPPQPHFAA